MFCHGPIARGGVKGEGCMNAAWDGMGMRVKNTGGK